MTKENEHTCSDNWPDETNVDLKDKIPQDCEACLEEGDCITWSEED